MQITLIWISQPSVDQLGKFVDTPYGIFELKYFFTDSIALSNGSIISTFVIKRVLENIIHSENKESPYSDDLLVKKLHENGYLLARRTIAKYRDQLGYPVARLRKKNLKRLLWQLKNNGWRSRNSDS